MNKSRKNKIKTNKELSYARNKLNIHINSKQKQNVKTKKKKKKKQTKNQKRKPDQTGLLSPYMDLVHSITCQLHCCCHFFPSFTPKLHRFFSQKSILKLQNSEVLPTGTAVAGRMAGLGH